MNRAIIAFLLMTTAAWADVIRPQCQTEESRGLRFTSIAMYKAADDSDPWRSCSNCSLPSSVVDTGRATQERFRAEGHAALLKARALEAAHCPEIADAIMNNIPATDEEKASITTEFSALMQKEYEHTHKLRVWQREHPQCEHVTWWWGSRGGSKEDFEGKNGQCSADGAGEQWRGTKDDMKMFDPVTNELIAKVARANALRKHGFGDGSYADPKLCSEK